MYQSPSYPKVSDEVLGKFMDDQFHVKVIAVGPDGFPRVSLLPFVRLPGKGNQPDVFEVHMVQEDATFKALRANPKASLLFDQPLAFTPHDWVDPMYAGMATLHFRAINVQATADTFMDAKTVADFLARLLKVYEPDAAYHPIETGGIYDKDLSRLAAVRFTAVAKEAKWKLAQNRSDTQRDVLFDRLRKRGLPLDAMAAEVIDRHAKRAPRRE